MNLEDLIKKRILAGYALQKLDGRCSLSIESQRDGYVLVVKTNSQPDAVTIATSIVEFAREAVAIAPFQEIILWSPSSLRPLIFPVKDIVDYSIARGLPLPEGLFDKKLRSEKMNKLLKRFEAFVDDLDEWIFVFSYEGIYLDIYTQKPSQLMGSKENSIGRHFQDVLPSWMAEMVAENNQKAIESQEEQIYYYECTNQNRWGRFYNRVVPIPESQELVLAIRQVEAKTLNSI